MKPNFSLPPAFTSRPATLADAEAVASLLNRCSMEWVGAPETSAQDILSFWTNPMMNLERDTLLILDEDQQVVAYGEMYDSPPHVRLYLYGRVHPEWKGKGLGTALIQWGLARAALALESAPAEARVVVHQYLPSQAVDGAQLLERSGFRHIRNSYQMRIEFNTPPQPAIFPEGIQVRPVNLEQDLEALIHAHKQTFKDHWGYVETPMEEALKDWRHWIETDPHVDPALWFVAMNGGEIAGYCLCSTGTEEDPQLGWINLLGVRREWRKHGLGLALLLHGFHALYQRGFYRIGLGVDASNLTGATRLYQRAGMHVHREYHLFEYEMRPGKDYLTQTIEGHEHEKAAAE
ncbi:MULTISPECIES: GNAT family N-acetyltransferase [Anaerolinea]|uniref:GNAT family N-acetyltransferase n=1 Tax=Anaerolinea TaxID=233189 RepID=UPI002627838B|nr:GNAT family N-acetyltransferase [Anaerolinea thermophila]